MKNKNTICNKETEEMHGGTGSKIKSRFFRSFLYYIPYAVLSAMTIPAIFYTTHNMWTAAAGTAVALLLAFFEMPLIVVALAASGAAFLLSLFI